MDTLDSLKQLSLSVLPKEIDQQTYNLFINCWVDQYSQASQFDPSKFKEPFEDFLRLSINYCVTKYNLLKVINKEVIEKLIFSWTQLQPWPKTRQTLKLLNKKYLLGIMSNGSKQSLQQLAKNSLSDIEFSYFFDSTEAKYFKPRPEMYQQVQLSGFTNDQILHVAGAAMDVKGARNYGLFVGHNQIAGDEEEGFTDDQKACFQIKDIQGLIQVMQVDNFVEETQ